MRSNLTDQALDIAFSAVEFNPNSAAAWALILVNPSASQEDRVTAKERILELDPFNKDVVNFNF